MAATDGDDSELGITESNIATFVAIANPDCTDHKKSQMPSEWERTRMPSPTATELQGGLRGTVAEKRQPLETLVDNDANASELSVGAEATAIIVPPKGFAGLMSAMPPPRNPSHHGTSTTNLAQPMAQPMHAPKPQFQANLPRGTGIGGPMQRPSWAPAQRPVAYPPPKTNNAPPFHVAGSRHDDASDVVISQPNPNPNPHLQTSERTRHDSVTPFPTAVPRVPSSMQPLPRTQSMRQNSVARDVNNGERGRPVTDQGGNGSNFRNSPAPNMAEKSFHGRAADRYGEDNVSEDSEKQMCLHFLAQQPGWDKERGPDRFNMNTSLADLSFEITRVTADGNENRMVNIIKGGTTVAFMAIEKGINATRMVDMTGWSNEAQRDMTPFDGPIRRLYRKHCPKASATPEFELVWALGQSMVNYVKNKPSDGEWNKNSSSPAGAPGETAQEPSVSEGGFSDVENLPDSSDEDENKINVV
jgi:hypothetical protein